MADNKTQEGFAGASNITRERLERLEELLEDMKADARKCHDEKDFFMLGVYERLLAVASPIVVKASARAEREELAALRKARKDMRPQSTRKG